MKEQLSKVFFDGQPVTLMGDEARPPLSRIVRAGGKRPDRVDVVVLASRADMMGQPVAAEEIIDRTADPTTPIYLRSTPRLAPAAVGDPVAGQPGRDPARREGEARGTAAPFQETPFRSPSQAALPPEPETVPRFLTALRRKASNDSAEAEAEERQEEERDQQNALQDEQEELEAAEEDSRSD